MESTYWQHIDDSNRWLWLRQMTDPSSRQRGRPHRQNCKCLTETKILFWAPDGAWHQDWLADWPSVVIWLWVSEWVSEWPLESPQVEGEWPVVVRALLSPNRRPHFKTRKSLWKNKNMVMGLNGTRNRDWLCWRGPAAIFSTRPLQSIWERMFGALTRKPWAEQYSLSLRLGSAVQEP
jgi:hypothetical protein